MICFLGLGLVVFAVGVFSFIFRFDFEIMFGADWVLSFVLWVTMTWDWCYWLVW